MVLSSLTLINADTGQPIRQLKDNAIIDVSKDGPRLSIRANPSGFFKTRSVVFKLTGPQNITYTDSSVPYALLGNTGSAYNPWTPSNGSYGLEARPYTGVNATGTKGFRYYVTFDVINANVTAPPNNPPTLNAGADQDITLPTNSVTLNAASSDVDGFIASRLWTQVSGPNTANIASTTQAQTLVSGLVAGIYVFNHKVTDDDGASANDTVTVTVRPAPVPNVLPTVNAGPNQTITLPSNIVNLSGTASDSDGTIVSYLWTQVSGPSTATLSSTTQPAVVVSGLIAGSYLFRLQVTDNRGGIAADDVQITVNAAVPVNQAPIANAGANKAITLPTNLVSFNGINSTDADGTIVSYRWTQVSGPSTATISNPNSAPTNVSNFVAGTYVFRLTVTDDDGATGFDDVTLVVYGPANLGPTANAGADKSITLPTNSVVLTGAGSDPEGGVLTYLWTKTSGGAATIVTPTSSTTSVTGLVQGTYIFNLRVTDDKGLAANDTVTVTVLPLVVPNVPPAVNAGTDATVTLPTNSIILTATASDSDGTIVSRQWSKISGPTSFTINSPTAAQTVVSGLVQGTYVFTHTVTDDDGASASDSVSVVVQPAIVPNNPPIANAGINQTITLPTSFVNLSGSGTDSDGTITAFLWSQVSGPSTAIFSSTNLANIVVSNLVAGSYTFRLRVTDDDGATATDDVLVVVNSAPVPNQAPSSNAGANKTITLPTSTVSLTGLGTDSDGTITAYRWTQVSGPNTATIVSPNSANTNVNNLIAGTYTFRLTVTDDDGATGTDDVNVVVNQAPNQNPTANAGSDGSITLPTNSINLIGSGSDPDGTISAYQWSRISGPTTFTIQSPTSAQTLVSNLVEGTYVFQLQVTDNRGGTAVDTVSVVVNPEITVPPTGNTYYASPTGTGNGTIGSPFKISNFWNVAKAGYTLILLDGTYTGASSMINPPTGLHGTSTAPITIKAQNDGKVDIDGQRLNRPLDLQGNNYFVFEGFNAHHSVYGFSIFVIVRSNNNVFRRIIGWETSDGNVNIWNLRESSFNLIEDCAGWGTARKIFGATQRADNNIFRRCFGRWEGSIAEGPKKVMTLSYNSYNNIAENCVGTWDSLKMPQTYNLMDYNNQPVQPIQSFTNFQVQQPGGIFGNDGFDLGPTVPSDVANIKFLGCVAFLKQSQRYHNSTNRGNAGPYYLTLKGTTVTNCVSFIEPGANHQYIYPISCEGTGGTTSQSQLINCTRIGGTQTSGTIDTSSWGITSMLSGSSCSVIPSAGTIVKPTTSSGAVVEKRYVNGVLTNENLWPWPMNQRIIDAMIQSGYTGDKVIDVTASVFGLCGDAPPNPGANIVQKAKSWLTSTGSSRTALEADLAAYNTDIDSIINQLKPVYTKTQTGKLFYQNFTNATFASRYPSHQYHMYVPSHYKPNTPFGLILWLHGGGSWDADEINHLADFDMDDETVTGRSFPRTETDTSNYILVAPIAPFGSIIPHPQHVRRWDVPVADQYLIDIITEVSTHYNVDFNKVVVAGFSMGGIGAYHMAMRLNDRLAAVMASAGAWEHGSWASLKNMPMYIIHGQNDAFFNTSGCRPHFTDVKYATICHEILSTTSNIHSLNLYPGGHSWDSTAQNAWRTFINGQTGWVTTKTRNPYRTNTVAYNPWRTYETADSFTVTWTEDPSPHTLWLSINQVGTGTISYDQALDQGNTGEAACTSQTAFNNWSLTKTTKNLPGARAEANLLGSNKISVTTSNVKNLSIWLHPNMVDLSQPVQVSINGGAFTSYTPQPSLLKALQSYERRWDWKMIYHAEIVIPL